MIRSGISWATAVNVLETHKTNIAKALVKKIEAKTHDRPLSAMIEIDLTAPEARLVEDAIRAAAV